MSNIGRRPIELGPVTVDIKGNEIHYKGPKATGVYTVPSELLVKVTGKSLELIPQVEHKEIKHLWGLHRALLFNAISGAAKEFQKQLKIVGLGFKAIAQGPKVQFSLGFSHKIDLVLPEGVLLEIDKTGQLLTFKSTNKTALGQVCSTVRAFRPPEPYKGTGIQYVGERIIRKSGKAKSS